jgi:hypothetical protein
LRKDTRLYAFFQHGTNGMPSCLFGNDVSPSIGVPLQLVCLG